MPALTLERCETCKKYEDQCSCDSLELTPSQMRFVNSDKRFVYLNGGRNTGKGWSACLKMAADIEAGLILPGARILVLGPTYPQLKKSCVLTFDKILGDAGMILEKIDGNEPERRLVNDIVAYFRNASNPDQTRGHEVQVVWLDEAAQMEEQVLALTNMTMRQFGDHARYQTLITTTPRGRNWLWRTFVNPETRKYGDDKVEYIHTTTLEAYEYGIVREGYLDESIYIPGSDMWKQEILAEFNESSGYVFHYNPSRETPDPFILPKFKMVVGGIDIGTTEPTALVLVGIDEQGKYWCFKEHYQKRANFHDILRIVGEWTRQYEVRAWSIDSAANLEARMLKSAGLPVRNSLKAKDAAGTVVNFVNSLMERDMFRISPECRALIMEIEGYAHKEHMSGDETTFLDKVKPNQPDHAIDAMRYALAPLSMGGMQQKRQTHSFAWGRS